MSQYIVDVFINTINDDNNLKITKKRKETGSMVEILDIPSSQSFTIKLGNTIEKCFKYYVSSINGANIISNTILGNKQADLYFLYKLKYYFEGKNNVNLDTEKIAEVVSKLEMAKREGIDVVGCVSFRCSTKEELKKFTKPPLYPYLFGYNDFFNIFDDNLTKEEFEIIINKIKEIFIGVK